MLGYVIAFAIGTILGIGVMGFIAGGDKVQDKVMIAEVLSHKVYKTKDTYMKEMEQVLRGLLNDD